jgi:hypothetical protein
VTDETWSGVPGALVDELIAEHRVPDDGAATTRAALVAVMEAGYEIAAILSDPDIQTGRTRVDLSSTARRVATVLALTEIERKAPLSANLQKLLRAARGDS